MDPNKEPRYLFVVPVWGERYIDIFLTMSLPTQLSPGNLEGFKDRDDITYLIVTRPQDKKVISNSKIILNLSRILNVRVEGADEVEFDSKNHYEPFSACYKIGMKQAEKYQAACIFLTADQIWADGAFVNIIQLAENGKKVVLISGPRVEYESFAPDFFEKFPKHSESAVQLTSRQVVNIAQKHLHLWDRSLFRDTNNKGRPGSFMFWQVKNEGFLMRCFHLHPILVNPVNNYPDFTGTIDNSEFISSACPNLSAMYVVEDSDEVMFFSVAPAKQSAELIKLPLRNWKGLIMWTTHSNLNKYNFFYLRHKIRFHTKDLSGNWSQIERLSDDLVNRMERVYFNRLVWIFLVSIQNFYFFVTPFVYRIPFLRSIFRRFGGMLD